MSRTKGATNRTPREIRKDAQIEHLKADKAELKKQLKEAKKK